MKLYGSLENRLEENRQFVEEIKVGTGVTEYSYTDREAYEVIAVKDQKHITIRRLDHKLVGDAYSNNWELSSNENNTAFDIVKRGKYWYIESTMTKERLLPFLNEDNKLNFTNDKLQECIWIASNFDIETVLEKGKQTKYHKINISIGTANYYYDYSF